MARQKGPGKGEIKFNETIAAMIEQIESGDLGNGHWEMPWDKVANNGLKARRFDTGYEYTMGNALQLAYTGLINGWDSGLWGTYNQWEKAGYVIGGTGINCSAGLWQPRTKKVKNKETGEDEIKFFGWSCWPLWSAEQMVELGFELPEIERPEKKEFKNALAHQDLEDIKGKGLKLRLGGDRAFFAPVEDYVQVPHFEQFKNEAHFWGTMMHEITHWSGGKTRLNRDVLNGFGSEAYAREELVAEIGASMFAMRYGYFSELSEHNARYIKSWKKAIKDDPKCLTEAASAAGKAYDFIIALCDEEVVKEEA